MVRVYFQTQGKTLNNDFHSDGCCPSDEIDRAFFHALLDEWLNNLPNITPADYKGQLLSGPSLVFGICGAHKE
jgi:hypothetical protein